MLEVIEKEGAHKGSRRRDQLRSLWRNLEHHLGRKHREKFVRRTKKIRGGSRCGKERS